jgi:hypothetical protein
MPDAKHEVSGYECVRDFRSHSWVIAGSRIYPSATAMWLNSSQDLAEDLHPRRGISDTTSLVGFLRSPDVNQSLRDRVTTSLWWYVRSVGKDIDDELALVFLAIAFESLLRLEQGEKITERFRDAVSLLLGRLPRLDIWLSQFYIARSQIVHEGRARSLHFMAVDIPRKPASDSQPQYRSLVSYGRLVFRACLGTLISGSGIAQELSLPAMLFTNQQRFERICEMLSDDSLLPEVKILETARDVRDLERYQFVAESGLRIETLIGAARLAARAFCEVRPSADETLLAAMARLASAPRSAPQIEALTAVRDIQDLEPIRLCPTQLDETTSTVYTLLDVVWHYTFMHFYWLQQRDSHEHPA